MKKLSEREKEQIVIDYASGKHSYASLAKKYGVSRTSIGRLLRPDAYRKELEKNLERNRNYTSPNVKKQVSLRLYEEDADIIAHLDTVPQSVQTYIKETIRNDMKNNS